MATNRVMPISFFRSAYPWLIVICGMVFYCYNYFLRVSPSVMEPELIEAFHINAAQFGALAGLYYYAYAPMQIPAGMLYDKFGVRVVLSLACLVSVCGLMVFINADNYFVAGLGRFLIGLGCAFAYIGTLKLASIWLAPERFGFVAGLSTAVGMASGALAQKYLSTLVEVIGYKQALHTALLSGFVLSIALFFFVRNRPRVAHDESILLPSPMTMNQLFSSIGMMAANPQMWLIGIIGCLLYLPSSVFLDLWGIPYLQTVHHLTSEQAVTISSYTFYGWIISGPIIGAFSDRIGRRCLPLTITGSFAAVLLCVVFYVPGITLSWLYVTFFMVGFCCGAHPLCFALGKESNPIEISGTAVAVTNMLIMAGGMIFQPLVGWLLDFHSTSPLGADGLPSFTPSDYTFALSVVPLGVALGIFLSLFLKETYCKCQASDENKRLYRRK